MHEAECRGDSPETLLARDIVGALGHLDPAGLGLDAIRSGVRRPELERPSHPVQGTTQCVVGTREAPIGERGGLGSAPQLGRHDDLEGVFSPTGADESQGFRTTNAKPEFRRGSILCGGHRERDVHHALRNAWIRVSSCAQNHSNRVKFRCSIRWARRR